MSKNKSINDENESKTEKYTDYEKVETSCSDEDYNVDSRLEPKLNQENVSMEKKKLHNIVETVEREGLSDGKASQVIDEVLSVSGIVTENDQRVITISVIMFKAQMLQYLHLGT